MINYTLRSVEPDDSNFIYSSWLKSNRKSDTHKRLTNDIYYHYEGLKITSLLEKSAIIVACNKDNPSQIFGWCVVELIHNRPVIHFIYVKYPYRRLGLGKALLTAVTRDSETPIYCTHTGWKWEEFKTKYTLCYHPYLIKDTP